MQRYVECDLWSSSYRFLDLEYIFLFHLDPNISCIIFFPRTFMSEQMMLCICLCSLARILTGMSTLVKTLVRIYTAFVGRVLLRGSFLSLMAWRAYCTGSLALGPRQQSFSGMSIYLTTMISWIFCNSSGIIERRPQRPPSGITMVGGCGSDRPRHVAPSSMPLTI